MKTRVAYPYGRSRATRTRHSEPESSALQNVEHATKRVRVDIGVDANPFAITEINFNQPCLLRRRSGRTRRLFCRLSDARRLDMALRIGPAPNPEPQFRQAPFPLASLRKAKIRLGAIPCLRATSDTFAPAADVSARILALSSEDQWRRCFRFAKISTRIAPVTSSLDQGHMLRRSRESNKAVLTKGTRICTRTRPMIPSSLNSGVWKSGAGSTVRV